MPRGTCIRDMASIRFLHRALALTLGASFVTLPVPAFAQDPDPSTMSDKQKMKRAKKLYGEGEEALAAEDPATALMKFEQAYNDYAPNLHLFNFNIGIAAHQLGDCVKAKAAFGRFLDLVSEHPARGQAQEKLLEIERSQCAVVVEEPPPDLGLAPSKEGDNYDAPDLEKKERAGEGEEDEEESGGSRRGKLVGGAVLAGVGGVALIGGVVSLGIANKRANELITLSSPGPTGYPPGDYSQQELADLDRKGLPAANAASVGLFVSGGVLVAAGVALIVLDLKGGKKEQPADADETSARKSGPRVTSVGPTFSRNGAGMAATLRF